MLELFDRGRTKIAILQNAFDITEEQKINAVDGLSFSLPGGDPKAALCQTFCLVRYNGGQLYRILPEERQTDETEVAVFTCEHVISSLLDELLLGFHIVGNIGTYTRDCINYVLNRQTIKNWVLDRCAFSRQFEYGWQDENLLGALFSIPQCFTEKYIWRFDTSAYPWKLNLDKLDESALPQLYVRGGKNLLSLVRRSEPENLCTRLYCKGYGEGVNQLGIEAVNGGFPYVQSPAAVIAKYGIISRVWIDRRYENPNSLLEAGKAMLTGLQEPYVEYRAEFAALGGEAVNCAEVGKTVEIIWGKNRVKTLVTGVHWNHGDVTQSTLTIANSPRDIAGTVAELADRQRIESTYAQGATQLYAQSLQANADSQSGAVLDFYIPAEMRMINAIKCKIRLGSFRAYSKATENGGASTQTSSSGGSTNTSTSAGGASSSTTGSGGGSFTSTEADGGVSTSTDSGGDTTATTSNGGDVRTTSGASSATTTNGGGGGTTDVSVKGSAVTSSGDATAREGMPHRHKVEMMLISHRHKTSAHSHGMAHTHSVSIAAHSHKVEIRSHNHRFQVPRHSHNVDIPEHSHAFAIRDHSHSVTIQPHDHSVAIPGHKHEVTPGIYFFGGAGSFSLYVNGKLKTSFNTSDTELDLTSYLLDSSNRIPRGSWQKVEVRPNGLAYVSIALSIQGFVQSRGDRTV